jgi:hypothetical protein
MLINKKILSKNMQYYIFSLFWTLINSFLFRGSEEKNIISSTERNSNETCLGVSFQPQPDNNKKISENSHKMFPHEIIGKLTSEFKISQNSQFKTYEKLCSKYRDLQEKYVESQKIISDLKRKERTNQHINSNKLCNRNKNNKINSKLNILEGNKGLDSELEKSKKTIAILKNELSYYRTEAKKFQKESEILADEIITIRSEFSKLKNTSETSKKTCETLRVEESKDLLP